MPFITISRVSVGDWNVRVVPDEDAMQMEGRGDPVAHVDGGVLEAWYRHRDECAVWGAMWAALESSASHGATLRSGFEVVANVPGIGEVRRGPFSWDDAIKERSRVAARIRGDVSVRPVGRSRTCPGMDAARDTEVADPPEPPPVAVPRRKTRN